MDGCSPHDGGVGRDVDDGPCGAGVPPAVWPALVALLAVAATLLEPTLTTAGTGVFLVVLSPAAGALGLVLGLFALAAPVTAVTLACGLRAGSRVARALTPVAAGALLLGIGDLGAAATVAALALVLALAPLLLAPRARAHFRRADPAGRRAGPGHRATAGVVAAVLVGGGAAATGLLGVVLLVAGATPGSTGDAPGPALLVAGAGALVVAVAGGRVHAALRRGGAAPHVLALLVAVAAGDAALAAFVAPSVERTLPFLVGALLAAAAVVALLLPDARRPSPADPLPA